MAWYNWVIPIVTLLVGLAGGFFGGTYYLRKQVENMQMDDKQIQAMARSMGMNLNQKQLKQMSRNMKNMKMPKKFGK
ncbi:YneF family protein [Brevibacillus ruminantium]|uniref:YneF family protein n=1 Tax=Brevibacillus ruminantium TaxID=2950604 RepID=A0ABY4WMW2_9BACL|nr:YneF family protein [Brevibacillus ruminantium]USG68496.1 YneF family protein [Brevibacillus ruminantium]